ncbi:MAG: hypothetical protein KF802_13925 [Bdellovibrionaceae bacterium]|nr:hypothetical protein [Pseudobdellovibrionaceae bacterium]MBX3033126.1 hypothetical protein [Pseudobdellovibrionaceae bacterium]
MSFLKKHAIALSVCLALSVQAALPVQAQTMPASANLSELLNQVQRGDVRDEEAHAALKALSSAERAELVALVTSRLRDEEKRLAELEEKIQGDERIQAVMIGGSAAGFILFMKSGLVLLDELNEIARNNGALLKNRTGKGALVSGLAFAGVLALGLNHSGEMKISKAEAAQLRQGVKRLLVYSEALLNNLQQQGRLQ